MPPPRPRIYSQGFTLIELVIVVVVVGILATLTISTINITAQKNNAEDTLRRSNIDKVIDGIEAYQAFEREYPADANNDDIPDNIENYIEEWPNGSPTGAVYKYGTTGHTRYGVVVEDSNGDCIKYTSQWGRIRVCSTHGSCVSNPGSNSCP